MMSNYGVPAWNLREEVEADMEGFDLQGSDALGTRFWAQSSVELGADNFWNEVARLFHALAVKGGEDAGYRDGFSNATASKQVMDEIALANVIKETA